MAILIINHREVEELIPMSRCIELMEKALVALARGEASQPLRTIFKAPHASGFMGLMPAYLAGERAAYGLKAICIYGSNSSKGLDSHQGGVMLFSRETGEPVALVNASAVTAIRTAAVSALATRLLARPDASRLAIIGTGVQARAHLEAMACVRSINQCRIVGRSHDNARGCVQEVQNLYSFPIEAVSNPEEALRDADLIVTATTATEPVLRLEWVKPGAHICAVGACTQSAREIDSATMAAAKLFVDRRESTLNEAGDYLIAASEGVIGAEHIRAEIGEVLTGIKSGRSSPEEITLFKSLGLAVEDLVAADYIYQQAQAKKIGTLLEF